MRRTLKATGVALVALAAVAATTGTAAAYNGSGGAGTCPESCSGSCTGTGPGFGSGSGLGRGEGRRGTGLNLANTASGSMTSSQRAALSSMAEEEKLAHDVYLTLSSAYPDMVQFDRIAAAETQHLAAVRVLLDRYDIPDPTVNRETGDFRDPRFDALYDDLIESSTTPAAALQAGVTIETADIADLGQALAGLTAPDVQQVYTRLLAGSQRHLAAFGG